jgi:hypothetical protein
MHSVKLVFALMAVAGLSACAPTIWDRPGTSQAEFGMDKAQCRLWAEGAVPDSDVGTINTGHFKRDLAANAAAGLVVGIAQGMAVQHKHDLCMEAKGYVARAPGAPGTPQVAANAAPPVEGVSASVSRTEEGAPMVSAPPPAPVQRAASQSYYQQASCPPGYAPHWYGADLAGKPILTCR